MAAGLAHVFRFEDQTFGDRPAAGVGLTLQHRSGFGVDLGVDRPFGLEPRATPCAFVNITCTGSGRDGPLSMTVGSIGARYLFKGRRVRPYVFAGLGMMWSRSAHSLTQVQGPGAVISESESSDHGVGPDVGAGLQIRITDRLIVSPELRWLDASITSRENIAATRLLLRVSFTP